VLLAAGVTGAIVVAFIVDNPAVEASIETEVPSGPIELAGHVSSSPILAELGALELTWNPLAAEQAPAVTTQSITLEMNLSARGCARLARIGGACGSTQAPPLAYLESLAVEAEQRSLHASVAASSGSLSELEQIGETAHSGSPVAWSVRNGAPRLAIHISCAEPLVVDFTATSIHPRTYLAPQSVSCVPGGVPYRLRVIDAGPTVTTVGFDRVLRFQSAAEADRGTVTVEHGTSIVDGDASQVGRSTEVTLQAEPGSNVSSRVVSPMGKAGAEVILEAPRAAHDLVDGDEKTPDELERLPSLLTTGLLISWVLFLLGTATKLLLELPPRRRRDAPLR
jgi:hypothetical protein